MPLVYREITGRFLDIDGTPKQGLIEFTPNISLVSTGEGIVSQQTVAMSIQEDGTISGHLACTDSPNVFPVGWVWVVEEKIHDGDMWLMELPQGDGSIYSIISSKVPALVPPGYQIQGTPGPPNVLTVADTITGPAGSEADVTIAGTTPAQALTFTIPRGDKGDKGDKGDPGSGVGASHGDLSNLATGDDHPQYVLAAGDTMPGRLRIQNGTLLDSGLIVERTVVSTSTNDIDIVSFNYGGERQTWINEKGNLRTSNTQAPGEDALKIIGDAVITGNYLSIVAEGGAQILRVGSLGRLAAYKGMRLVGDTLQIRDATEVDESTITQVMAGDLVIVPKRNLSVSSKKIVSLADGTLVGDAVNLGQLNAKPIGILQADADLRYVDVTGDKMTGNLTVETASGATVLLDGPAGTNRSIRALTGGTLRWLFGAATQVETGSNNEGSDFGIYRYNDAGAGQSGSLIIRRSTGAVEIPNLKAGYDQWIAYTPTVTNASRASSECWYYQTPGGLVHYEFRVTVNSVSGNVTLSIPVAALADTHGELVFEDTSAGLHYPGYCMVNGPGSPIVYTYWITPATGVRVIIGATSPFTWAAGDIIRGSVTYRAASL